MHRLRFRRLSTALMLATLVGGAGVTVASAQFGPPSTMFGSITETGKTIDAGVVIEAYVGETLCGKNETRTTGDGNAKVTVYSVHVVSREQTPGCGTEGSTVRIKVGDRFAEQTAKWTPGPVELNLMFAGATPAPIPTFTPAPTQTEAAGGGTTGSGASGGNSAAKPGGVTSTSPNATGGDADEDGGFPVWPVVIGAVVLLGVVGGGAGYALSRNRSGAEES